MIVGNPSEPIAVSVLSGEDDFELRLSPDDAADLLHELLELFDADARDVLAADRIRSAPRRCATPSLRADLRK
jgi:hypothetical protein